METLYFGSDNVRTARNGWIFLVSSILLLVFVEILPPHVAELGLLGTSIGLRNTPHHLAASAGLVLLFGCCHFFLDLVFRGEGWRCLLSGWPNGSLRTMQWARLFATLCIGLCLSCVSQLWVALAFCVTLLQFFRDARRLRTANLRKLADLLTDLRLCWLAMMLGQTCLSSHQPSHPQAATLSLVVVTLALGLQIYPRLSFAACFLHSKPMPQFTMERCLWQTRLERVVVAVVTLYSLFRPGLLPLLVPFCLGRFVFVLTLRAIYLDSNWTRILRSKPQMWCFQVDLETRGMVPDEASLAAFCPKKASQIRPMDRFGHGPLTTNVSAVRGMGFSPHYTLPIEAIPAMLLLVIGLAVATPSSPLSSAESVYLTSQTRAVEAKNQTVLYHAGQSPGTARLLETLPYRSVEVDIRKEPLIISSTILLLTLLGCYFRWRQTLLGMWFNTRGFSRRDSCHLVCMSLLVTLGLTSWLGWFWHPVGLPLLCLIFLSLQRRLNLSALSSTSAELREQIRLLFALPVSDPPELPAGKESWESLSRATEIRLEVGRRLLFLVEPRNGVPFIKREAIHVPFRKALGFELPKIYCRDNLQLQPCEYRLLINDVQVLQGAVKLSFTVSEHNLPVADILTRGARADILAQLKENAHLLVTRMTTERMLRAATASHPRLVTRVRERQTPTTVKQVLKALVKAGYNLNKVDCWLHVFATKTGGVDELTKEVLAHNPYGS